MIIVTNSGSVTFSDEYVQMLEKRVTNSKPLTKDEEADYKLIQSAKQKRNGK